MQQRRLHGKAEFCNNAVFSQDSAECVTFLNEIVLDAEGWAHLAPLGDFPGRGVVVEGGEVRTFPGVQRVDRAACEAMVGEFNNAWNRIKRRFAVGVSIYRGHPDAPGGKKHYPDAAPKGMITELRLSERGLECRPAFNHEGAELLDKNKLCFSTRWQTEYVGEENGRKVFRPVRLLSAGLVSRSNLPVEYLNERKSTMDKNKLTALLKRLGVELSNEATDEQVNAALDQADQAMASFSNDKTGLENKVTERDTKIVDLARERDEARAQFSNEREARITDALEGAVSAGKITAAERLDWERRLKADFANELPALGKLARKVKTVSVTAEMGGRKIEMANAADRRSFVNAALDQVCREMALDKVKDYDRAFEEVRKRFPQVFEAMAQ